MRYCGVWPCRLADLLEACVAEGEGPLGVECQLLHALHRYQEAAVLLLALHWPVLVTLPLNGGRGGGDINSACS